MSIVIVSGGIQYGLRAAALRQFVRDGSSDGATPLPPDAGPAKFGIAYLVGFFNWSVAGQCRRIHRRH